MGLGYERPGETDIDKIFETVNIYCRALRMVIPNRRHSHVANRFGTAKIKPPHWKGSRHFPSHYVGRARFKKESQEFTVERVAQSIFSVDNVSHERITELDLFAFIHHAYPTKVQIWEREVRKGEDVGVHVVNEESGDAVVADHIEESGHVIQDEGANIVRIEDEVPATVAEKAKGSRKKRKAAGGYWRKSIAALKGLLERNTLPVEVGVTVVATMPFITSYVSLMPEREGDGRTDSVTGPNLRTRHPAKRFVVLSDSPCHSSSNATDAEVSFVVKSLISELYVMTSVVATTVVADTYFVPVPRAGHEPVYQTIFADSASMGEASPDVEGPSHPAGTELSVNSFYVSQDVATVEAAEAARTNELNGLKERNSALEEENSVLEARLWLLNLSELGLSCDELSVKASSLEAEMDRLISQIEVVQDEQVKALSDKVAGLDAELMGIDVVDNFKRCCTSYTFVVGYRVLIDVYFTCDHDNSRQNTRQDGNGSFGIKDLCFRQELLEYMGVHDNDASESLKPSWGKMCTSRT
nr:hypothetical protein [Tanacetum cinerariifolium]